MASALADKAQARTPARAESVGSLIRPQAIKDAFADAYGGDVYLDVLTDEQRAKLAKLDRLATEATPELVRRQIEAGLDVVTDGELRRGLFTNSLIDAIDGIELTEEVRSEGTGGQRYGVPIIRERVTKKSNPALREAEALTKITDFPKKVTFPAASFFYYRMFLEVSENAYPDRDAFLDDLIAIQRELVDDVIAAGVEHIQFDFPLYPMLVDPKAHERAAGLGETPETLLEKALEADRRMVAEIPEHVGTGLHLCRGNITRFFSGSIEPIAERIFQLPYKRFLIEWHDTEADGPYCPIRFVPAPKVMVMGLISTKVPELEDEDELMGRMDIAASSLDYAQLAISPQCGFASIWRGHGYSEEIQWRKLELAGRLADRIWGSR